MAGSFPGAEFFCKFIEGAWGQDRDIGGSSAGPLHVPPTAKYAHLAPAFRANAVEWAEMRGAWRHQFDVTRELRVDYHVEGALREICVRVGLPVELGEHIFSLKTTVYVEADGVWRVRSPKWSRYELAPDGEPQGAPWTLYTHARRY